jgi:hypothetical protein
MKVPYNRHRNSHVKRMIKMTNYFCWDHRLGISLPQLSKEWEQYLKEEQMRILLEWEHIRGQIPDRIREVEQQIDRLQHQLGEEEQFERSCQINQQIAELASIINDLWIWYRVQGHITVKKADT